MKHCSERNNGGCILVAASSIGFIVLVSVIATFCLLSAHGQLAMDELQGYPRIHSMPKIDTGKLVIDTDAGVDDALAIFLALGFEAKQTNTNVRTIAITCVNGNTNVDNVVLNVLKVLKTAKRLDIPVYRGAERSLLVTPPIEDFYGEDGLGDFVFPDPPKVADYLPKDHAATALIRLVTQYPKQITLLCLGPLTNIALAIRLDPHFITKVKQIIILGGSTEGTGNVRPGVEFNFYVDPEANFIVFDAVNATDGKMNPIVLLPWESVVKRNLIPTQWRKEILGTLGSHIIQFMNLAERNHLNDDQKEWHSADALATAVTLDPTLVLQASPRYHAVAEVQGTNARGSLFVDYSKSLKNAPINVVIVHNIDIQRYKRMLLGFLT